MIKQLNSPIIDNSSLLVDSWNQEKVNEWLKQNGYGHFVSTFEKYEICKERFFQITLAELIHYLPRTITTYYERRRLLNEIRLLIPGQNQKQIPSTPTKISINTDVYDYSSSIEKCISPFEHTSLRDSGTSSLSSSSSDHIVIKKPSSPIRSPYSPKAAFYKIKNTFRSSDEKTSPRLSSSDKISKFWTNWQPSHPRKQIVAPPKLTEQKIQITKDKETWYSLNVTGLRDSATIQHHIINRMQLIGDIDQYHYFHENGVCPNKPMDSNDLIYLCSLADHSASQRILVLPIDPSVEPLHVPELGRSPSDTRKNKIKSPPLFKPLVRKLVKPHRGIQLTDPSPPSLWATPPRTEFWGERPPAQVVVEHMDDYFDLDKTIRHVAREASLKYHNVLRRKSTRLWGHQVVELKGGRTGTDGVEWIRGKLIGKGSFGRVYLAFNVATGEVIAVKQVEGEPVEALYREILMLRDLDHEHIVRYLGYGQGEGVIHIFLDYVAGGSVASRLALHGALDEPLTKYFTHQICLGLAYLHSKNILHRDIKAANILVEEDGTCKISDFGLSKKNDYDEVYDENSRMSLRGSVYWMAPEVVKNEPYSAKVDIWSLGCTVIEMLTGKRPWIALNQIAALYHLGRLNSPEIPKNISKEAKDFLKQCFIIDPLKRPTASDLLKHSFLKISPSFQFKDYIDKGKI